ncbi:unnamed protein product [Gongylonema pulchrum]|uniref:Mab-21 domain-containing protein n=1 Tax=Gongylonema pulchrum TaxID=637853 RepID=A0A183EUL0_9BILA|nr:unnamed protein product [Gongylonema pulchrum]
MDWESLSLYPPMDVYDYYTSRLSIACNEILSRIRDHSYGLDAYFLESVIDRIFNDPQIDLLSVLPRPVSDVGVEYDQVVEVVGTKSVAFKVPLQSSHWLYSRD